MNFPKKTMDELQRSEAEAHKNQSNHFPVIIILDNVRSMNNVGTVFRTSDAFNISQIILCGVTPTPPHRDIQKTALGATESVKWQYDNDISSVIKELKIKVIKL